MPELMKQISFAKLDQGMEMPHLLDIQTRAFESLLQLDAASKDREDIGLERVFKDLFPITDVHENFSLEFKSYALGEPKYSVAECIERDMTYSAPLKATLQLIVFETTEAGKRPKNIIEKEVYLGELPLLTPLGTFVINGAERVIVSQLHRSPGVVFEESTHPNGQRLISARIIPFRGSWVEFTVDIHDVVYVHIDKKKKFPATALLRAFGYGTNSQILRLFFAVRELDLVRKRETRIDQKEVLGAIIAEDITLAGTIHNPEAPKLKTKKARLALEREESELLVKEGDELTEEVYNRLRRLDIDKVKVFASYTTVDLRDEVDAIERGERPVRRVVAVDAVEPESGEVIADVGDTLTDTLIRKLRKNEINKVQVFVTSGRAESMLIKNTLAKDPTHTDEEALKQIYSLLRPGDAPKRDDLGRVGRYKINQRLGTNRPASETVLTKEDFVAIIRYLVELHEGRGYTDDIDHLGNRRIRSVGELIANQFSVGLSRMARLVKERMSINTDPEKISLDDLVNARTVSAVIQAFFGSSQLSQFMDQTNPLAELTHKRRLSALGPGGLTRERAGFEVRDVHYSQYGRMCPIETPEGPNIGLITSLACFARVNDLGFIETPYRVVKNGKVTDETRWLSASEEEEYAVAQANARLTPDGRFADELVLCRKRDDYPLVPPLFPQAPLVGTGLEDKVARDSGAVVIARRSGVVTRVTADEIIIDAGDDETRGGSGDHPLARLKQHDRYRLKKFWRTNQDTATNQRPLVHMGQKVKAGQIIADGAGTERGDLALGANVTVAFMPWYGHNFEDAIVLSERLVKDDVYSSIHIQELELHVRDTKRGQEEITREIPNVSDESVVDLDERGIVRIGAHVKPGDILVGKITPKGETELSPEEKLLAAIVMAARERAKVEEKAEDQIDKILQPDELPPGVIQLVKVYIAEKRKISVGDKMAGRHGNKGIIARIVPEEDMPFLPDGTPVDIVLNPLGVPSRMNVGQILETHLGWAAHLLGFDAKTPVFQGADETEIGVLLRLAGLRWAADALRLDVRPPELDPARVHQIVSDLRKLPSTNGGRPDIGSAGVELLGGRSVSAETRELHHQFVDFLKFAGKELAEREVAQRRIEQEMHNARLETADEKDKAPFKAGLKEIEKSLAKDKPAEVLEATGRPALAALFGAKSEADVDAAAVELLAAAGLSPVGKCRLRDGRTGELFESEVTVGSIYMMKLSHLVDDKIHARSIGPYSLVTQQPLAGKAQFGGQRFGEMEVWALEAYGAAHTLQEILTVKSDDVNGRSRVYEAIVKGQNLPKPGIPESFNVLVKELQALGLKVTLGTTEDVEE